jgi:hypothetical protein
MAKLEHLFLNSGTQRQVIQCSQMALMLANWIGPKFAADQCFKRKVYDKELMKVCYLTE